MELRFEELTLEQLKVYRASIEAYGDASELEEVDQRIKELEGSE